MSHLNFTECPCTDACFVYLEVLKNSLGSMPALVAMSTVRTETLERIRVKIRALKAKGTFCNPEKRYPSGGAWAEYDT